MQIIKQKSRVSANARSECVYLQNNLSKASILAWAEVEFKKK